MSQIGVTETGNPIQLVKGNAGEVEVVMPKLEKRVTIDDNATLVVTDVQNQRISDFMDTGNKQLTKAVEMTVKINEAEEEPPLSPQKVHRATCWPGEVAFPKAPAESLSKAQLPKNMSKPEFKNFLLRVMRKNESEFDETDHLSQTQEWEKSLREDSLQTTRLQNGSVQKPWLPAGCPSSTRIPSSKPKRPPENLEFNLDSLVRTNQSIIRYNLERKQRAEIAKKTELMKALEKQAEDELRSKIEALKKRQQIVENMERMEQRKIKRNMEIREGNRLLSALKKQTEPQSEQPSELDTNVMPHPGNSYAFLNMSKVFQRQNKLTKENEELREEVKKLRFVLDQFVNYFDNVSPDIQESQIVSKEPKLERQCSAKRRKEEIENTFVFKNDGYPFRPLTSLKDRTVAEHNVNLSKKLANLHERDDLNTSTDYRNHLPKLKINRSLRPGKGM